MKIRKPVRAQRAVRREHRRKDRGFGDGRRCRVVMVVIIRATMARKTPRKAARKTAAQSAAPRPRKACARRARARPPRSRARRRAPRPTDKAAAGATPPWTTAEIEEAFRRFQAANAGAAGASLHHVNPFTLLVAVVLSAQATDAGVNKATPALFAAADTPEKMVALGEAQVRELIKTIGLFRTKAKNVIALSQKLVAEHGGEVPRTREALRGAARRRPQDRQRRAQHRLRRADHRGRHPHLPRRQPHRPGARQDAARGRDEARSRWCRTKYKLHAHHWLILHGRYVCLARRPLCETCIIADLCKWPGKTVNA